MQRWQKITVSALLPPTALFAVGSLLDRILPTHDLPGLYSFLATLGFPWIAVGGLIVAWFVTKPRSEIEQ